MGRWKLTQHLQMGAAAFNLVYLRKLSPRCEAGEGRAWSPPSTPTSAASFGLIVVANLIFTPIQFGMRNLPLASVDILIVWVTIIWMMVAVWRDYRWVAVAQGPYLVWVSIAMVLQLSITAMNWGTAP